MEEASLSRAEAEAVFVEDKQLSGGSNKRRKWARVEEVSIGPRAEAMNGGRDAGGGGRRARDKEVIIRSGMRR